MLERKSFSDLESSEVFDDAFVWLENWKFCFLSYSTLMHWNIMYRWNGLIGNMVV